jgi:hypothetical protein
MHVTEVIGRPGWTISQVGTGGDAGAYMGNLIQVGLFESLREML